MILLDTNVISEPLHRTPEPRVIQWIDAQSLDTLHLSAITVAELRAGVARLPLGKRREDLHQNLEKRVLPLFIGRILPFDMTASQAYAEITTRTRASGIALSAADGFIAAIAATHGFIVATRDMRPFEAAAVSVINPWLVELS